MGIEQYLIKNPCHWLGILELVQKLDLFLDFIPCLFGDLLAYDPGIKTSGLSLNSLSRFFSFREYFVESSFNSCWTWIKSWLL